MRPSCGNAPLGDVEVRHDLEAGDQRRAQLERRLHDLLQNAVDAVPHAQLVLEALEVNVRCSTRDGVGEERVDELDDWRFLDGDGERRRRHVLFDLLDELDVGVTEGTVIAEQVSICASFD